jgi:hypothetical protein
MPLAKFQLRPGINREITNYSNEGGWFDGDKIRFRFGFPEKIGGWEKKSSQSFLGVCRALHPWVTLALEQYIGVGTSFKYYIERGGGFNDITPIRATTAAGDVTFAATDGSSTLTVSDTAHGAVAGDFVTFSGAVSLGGQITAAILNQEYRIESIVDADSYTITARAVASLTDITINGQYTPTPVLADSSDSGDGGAAVVGAYQINVGLDTAVGGPGWGSGSWSRGTWGSASNQPVVSNQLRIWSHDNFGEDLLMNVRDGGIYYWDASAGLTSRAVALSSLSGANTTPTVAKQIMVSDRDRHVLAFGCDPQATPGVQDPLTIRFSSQESLTDWAATPTNTAGELRLGSGSEIVRAIETRQQILVFTDTTLYAMQYLGPPFTFGVGAISENISILSTNSVVAVDDAVFWMGNSEFYAYSGRVENLPCTVRDYVFDDFNFAQALKVAAGLNSAENEIWWFYPSASSENVDRYVVFNYSEKVWYYGTLSRTAWLDRIDFGVFEYPISAAPDGHLYYQEIGFDDGSTNPPSPISAYVQSSPIDIGDGQQFMFISALLPDLSFKNSTNGSPTAIFTTAVRNYQQGTYSAVNASTFTTDTEQFFLRLRGRQMTMRVGSTDAGMTWRLGSPRYDIRPDGRR